MKVGEVYRYRHRAGCTIKIADVRAGIVSYLYEGSIYTFENKFSSSEWNQNFVLLSKLERLLEGIDEF